MYYLSPKRASEREHLLFGREYDPKNYTMGGICSFDKLDIKAARELVRAGFLDPDSQQNDSRSVKEIIEFCSGDDQDIWRLCGYAVSPARSDCRISIDGVYSVSPPKTERAFEFAELFRFADEFTLNEEVCSCWYD